MEKPPLNSWKEKFEGAEEIPGYYKPDIADLWRRMEEKLDQKTEEKEGNEESLQTIETKLAPLHELPRRKQGRRRAIRIMWNVAAASILLLFSISIFNDGPANPELIGNDPKTVSPVNKKPSTTLIAKDPVINKVDSIDPIPAKNLAIKPAGRQNTNPIKPVQDWEPMPDPVPKQDAMPLPLLIARSVEPFYIEHPNRAPFTRKKPSPPPVKHAGGLVVIPDETIRELTGFALFKNP